jgi:hypothetical protein
MGVEAWVVNEVKRAASSSSRPLHTLNIQNPTGIMAEILGIAESIAAICGAGDSAFKMARSMKRLSRDLGAARKDIRNFSRDIDAFSSIIGAARYTLETHSKPESRSKVLVFIHERQILDQLVDQSDRVIDHIRELRPSIKSLKSSISWVTRVKWISRRTDVKALGPKMESVKTSLNLLITMFSYEAIMQSIGLQVNSHNITDSTNREMSVYLNHDNAQTNTRL